MSKRVSIDEIIAKRKASSDDSGKLYTAVIMDQAESKGYDSEERSQRFIMSTETPDLYGDIVRQDGVKMDNFLKNPVALAYHNHRAPIGWWKDVSVVKGRPKRTEGVLTLHAPGTTEQVDEVERLLSAAAIRACSIGFMPMEAEWIVDADGRNTWGLDFKESSLLECSVCSIPANPEALAKQAGGDMKLAAELFERVLDTYCDEKSGGLYVRKEFADLYKEIQGNKVSRMTPKQLEHKVCETLVLDIDTREAEEKVDGLLSKLRKGVEEIFGVVKHKPNDPIVDVVEEYSPITLHTDGDGNTTVDEWPEKALASIETLAKEFGWEPPVDGEASSVEIKISDQIAVYRSVKKSDDGEIAYFELVEVKEIEPEPVAPVLVKGSRAQAEAKIAKLKASLLASAATS